MKIDELSCIWRGDIRSSLFKILFLLFLILSISCEGEQGPIGPQGPPGETLSLKIAFIGPNPVIRADGSSTLTIKVKVSTLSGNNAANIPVTFSITSGDGMLSPTVSKTDFSGEASCTYTCGTYSGNVLISASIEHAGLTISEQKTLYIDPLSVSPSLLNTDFYNPLRAHFSSDGNIMIFETSNSKDYSLFKVSAQGGNSEYFGTFRGGVWNPDGSNRIAAYTEEDSIYILDNEGDIIAGAVNPEGFYGTITNVGWNDSGEKLIASSNTNALVYIYDIVSFSTLNHFSAPVWISSMSPVAGTDKIVIYGGGEYTSGIYLIDTISGEADLLKTYGGGWYDYSSSSICGVSVDPTGQQVLFAAEPQTVEGYDNQYDIFMLPINGGEPTLVLSSPVEELYPQWYPDGSKILFCSNRSGIGYNLYCYDLNNK